MARYYFDLADHERSEDRSGLEIASADTARVQAVTFAGEYLRDHPDLLWDGHEIRVIVRNADDKAIFTIVILSVDCLEG